MLKQLKNDENGIVFVTVLMVIIMMTVLTLSIISMNISQVMVSENEIKRIQAEMAAQGGLAFMLANRLSNTPGGVITYPVTLGNAALNVTSNINIGSPNTGINNTTNMTITVDY